MSEAAREQKKTPAWDAGGKVGYGAIKHHLQAH